MYEQGGTAQDTRRQLIYHNNGIQTWHVQTNGEVENVEVAKLVAATPLACAIAMPVLAQGKLEAKPEAKSGPRGKIGWRRPRRKSAAGISMRARWLALARGQGLGRAGRKSVHGQLLDLPW
jgi:hypothetical protein